MHVVLAAAMIFLSWQTPEPVLGFEYSFRNGEVLRVERRGEVGLGDRVQRINGHPIGEEVYPLYFVRAGEGVTVALQSGFVERSVAVTTGAAEKSWVKVRMIVLAAGIAVLLLRPKMRRAALALIALAGSSFFFKMDGFGVVLGPMPLWLAVPVLAVDAFFCAAFFAYLVHFGLGDARRRWVVLAYVAALPIFQEALFSNYARLAGSVRPPKYVIAGAWWMVGLAMIGVAQVLLLLRRQRERSSPEP